MSTEKMPDRIPLRTDTFCGMPDLPSDVNSALNSAVWLLTTASGLVDILTRSATLVEPKGWIGLFGTLQDQRHECWQAIAKVDSRLIATHEGPVQGGSFHRLAVEIADHVIKEIWMAADPGHCPMFGFDENSRLDLDVLERNRLAVHAHFGKLTFPPLGYPRLTTIFNSCKWEAAKVGERGLLSDTDQRSESESLLSERSLVLLRVFTKGISDERIVKALQIVTDDVLSADERLKKIDALIRIPASASAAQLAQMLGVTKQSVHQTDWWTENRKGEKENEIGRRRVGHQRRAAEREFDGPSEDA